MNQENQLNKRKNGSPREEQSKEIPIEFIIPDESVIEFADSFFVQSIANGDRVFSFFQTQHPLNVPGREQEVESAKAVLLSRILVTEDHFLQIVDAVTKNSGR